MSNNFKDIFGDYFNTYKNTLMYKDKSMLEITLRKKEFEQNLDDMWKFTERIHDRLLNTIKDLIKSKKLV